MIQSTHLTSYLIRCSIQIGEGHKGQVVLQCVDDAWDAHLEGIRRVAEDIVVDVPDHPHHALMFLDKQDETDGELGALRQEDGGGAVVHVYVVPGAGVADQENVPGGVEGQHQQDVHLEAKTGAIWWIQNMTVY